MIDSEDEDKGEVDFLKEFFEAHFDTKAAPKKDSDLDIDSDTESEQVKKSQSERERYESDTKDRKWLAKWSTWVVSLWLTIVLGILFLNKVLRLELSDVVLAVLLGTTTLNILGLSFIVLRGHFRELK